MWGKCPHRSGAPLDSFLTVSPDVFIGCLEMKIPAKKLTANKKQGDLFGPYTMSLYI
jgi:hypothetical protein